MSILMVITWECHCHWISPLPTSLESVNNINYYKAMTGVSFLHISQVYILNIGRTIFPP